jgi:hypothetical protein
VAAVKWTLALALGPRGDNPTTSRCRLTSML